MGKNLKGGYQVIDLRNIDLTLTAEAQNITDVEVLEQLANLRDYIEPSHNYAKPLKKKLKPILVSIRDKKSDEEQESSIWANLSVYDDELSYKIEAVVDNSPLKVLQINVVFELVTEEDGSTHYEIDTATVLLSELVKMGDINVERITSKGIANTGAFGNIGDVAISGDLSVTGDLDVTGSINGEENPSVKPIYLHPISLSNDNSSHRMRLTCLVFNNDDTPFTLESFKTWFSNLLNVNNQAKIMMSGGHYDGNTLVIASHLGYTLATGYYYISGMGIDGEQVFYAQTSLDALLPAETTTLYDGVNKIN